MPLATLKEELFSGSLIYNLRTQTASGSSTVRTGGTSYILDYSDPFAVKHLMDGVYAMNIVFEPPVGVEFEWVSVECGGERSAAFDRKKTLNSTRIAYAGDTHSLDCRLVLVNKPGASYMGGQTVVIPFTGRVAFARPDTLMVNVASGEEASLYNRTFVGPASYPTGGFVIDMTTLGMTFIRSVYMELKVSPALGTLWTPVIANNSPANGQFTVKLLSAAGVEAPAGTVLTNRTWHALVVGTIP